MRAAVTVAPALRSQTRERGVRKMGRAVGDRHSGGSVRLCSSNTGTAGCGSGAGRAESCTRSSERAAGVLAACEPPSIGNASVHTVT